MASGHGSHFRGMAEEKAGPVPRPRSTINNVRIYSRVRERDGRSCRALR